MVRSKIGTIGTLSVTAFNSFPAGEYYCVQRTADEVGALHVDVTGGVPPLNTTLYITGRLGAGLNDAIIASVRLDLNQADVITGIELPPEITFLVVGGNGNADVTVYVME